MILILLTAWFITFIICKSLRVNVVLGYLCTGILLGPSGFKILMTSHILEHLGELGVSLFLFTVGVEIPWHRLIALRRYIFGVGVAQVLCSAVVLSGILCIHSIFLVKEINFIILFSLSLAFSSTAVIIQMLSERFELTSSAGRIALGILLFQDLVAIGMFAYLGLDTKTWSIWRSLGVWSVGIVLACGWFGFVGWACRQVMSRYGQQDIGLAFSLIMVLAGGMLTQYFGLSSELGAFLTGVGVAGTSWRHNLNAELHAFRTILFAFFFFFAGMEMNLGVCWTQLHWIISGVVILFLVKFTIMTTLARIWKFSWANAIQVGILIAGASEFLFIFIAHPAFKHHFSLVTQQIGFGITFCSILVTPFLFDGARYVLIMLEKRGKGAVFYHEKNKADVILAGFGHVGETVAAALEVNFISFLVVDYDIVRLGKAQMLGYPILHGEARNIEFLKKAGLADAKILLLTFGHSNACVELVRNVRSKFPQLYIAIHVRTPQQAQHFQGLDVFLIYPEALESGLQMAAISLECLGFSKEQATHMAQTTPKTLFMEHVEREDDHPEE
jgi:Kef-type K+ transport system membrane component KefB